MNHVLKRPLVLGALTVLFACTATNTGPPAPNGIPMPEGCKDWRVIGSSHRAEGSVLAKLGWEDRTHELWPTAAVLGSFVHAEFMFKDSGQYAATGGWGFARWLGLSGLRPHAACLHPGFLDIFTLNPEDLPPFP